MANKKVKKLKKFKKAIKKALTKGTKKYELVALFVLHDGLVESSLF